MTEVTDPALLEQLNSNKKPAVQSTEVTDPAILQQLQQSNWPPLVNSQDLTWQNLAGQVEGDRALENLPGSAVDFAKATVMPITHPIETAKSVAQAGEAVGQKAISNQLEFWFKNVGGNMGLDLDALDTSSPKWDQLTSVYKERYGSPEGVKETIETDPVGVLADIVSVFYGGLGAARTGIKMGAKALPDDLPNSMVEEVGKFPAARLTNEEVKGLTEFMLENDIRFTTQGIKKLDDIITENGKAIDKLIAKYDQGQTVPRTEIIATLRRMKRETVGKSALGSEDRKVIQKIIDGWEDEIRVSGKNKFTLPELQKFKQTTYGKINWNNNSNKKAVKNEALKRMALDAKARIENEVPGIKEANRAQGTGLELKPMLDKSTKRIDRNNKIGMDYLVSTGSGGMFGAGLDAALYSILGIPPGVMTGIGTTAGALKATMGQPGNKRALAQAIYDARRMDPKLIDEPLAKALAIYLTRENQGAIEARE